MKGKAFKILLIMAFMVVMFCAFSISSSAAQYEPDGTTSTQYDCDNFNCFSLHFLLPPLYHK